ncbi:MAG: hypothetical protein KatS3mg103_0199 [Phycisphaerales bacterium]|nr:MAG: hypothetical protein KatS3mg103_0199 [Phycisphaerales bacterium]
MAARRRLLLVLFPLAVVAGLAGAAPGQVGPPVVGWSAEASPEAPAVRPVQASPRQPRGAQGPAVGEPAGGGPGVAGPGGPADGRLGGAAAVAAGEAVATERPDESSMPLMGLGERGSGQGQGREAAGVRAGGWVRTIGSVGLVVGLILVLAALARVAARRSGSLAAMLGPAGRAPSGVLEVLARYPVGRGQVLVLLRVDRRVLLLSQSVGGRSAGFTTLAQFDEPSEVAAILRQTRDEAGESMSARFRQALERFQGGGGPIDRGEVIEVGPRGQPLAKGRGVWA